MCLNDNSVTKIYEFGESKELSIIFLTPNIENSVSKKFLDCVEASTIGVSIIAVASSGKGFSFARSWNRGIDAFKKKPSKFLILSHDDVEFIPTFLEDVYALSQSYSSDTILMPIIYEGGRLVPPFINFLPPNFFKISSLASYLPVSTLNLVEGLRNSLHERYFPESGYSINADKIKKVPPGTYPRLFPFCIMPQVTINKLSYFDENFFFGEDIEFTFRALLNGTQFGLIRNLSVNHYGSFNVGKRESKKGNEKATHIHKEMIAYRKLWRKYKYDYSKVKNMAMKNFFVI